MDMVKLMQDIEAEIKDRKDCLRTLFSEGFKRDITDYFYFGQGLSKLALPENYENLFVKSKPDLKIHPIFEHKEDYTKTEKLREKGTVHAVYYFDDPFSSGFPVRIEITNNTKSMKDFPALEEILEANGLFATKLVDIEFFEKIPMHLESRSSLGQLLRDYYKDAGVGRDFIEEFSRDFKVMQDTEKLHLQYVVALGKDKERLVIPVYIGIGTNQPFKLSEKKGNHGKNRYYRFSLLDGDFFEQTSRLDMKLVPEHERHQLYKNCNMDYSDPQLDGTQLGTVLDNRRDGYNVFVDDNGREFGTQDEGRYKRVFEWNGKTNTLKRVELVQDTHTGDGKEKIREIVQKRQFGSEIIRPHLENLFPEYDRFSQVFYNPFRIIQSLGIQKVLMHLAKHDLIDGGYLNIENTASDLFMNGFPDYIRMKGIALMAMNYINHGKLDELIANTHDGLSTKPL